MKKLFSSLVMSTVILGGTAITSEASYQMSNSEVSVALGQRRIAIPKQSCKSAAAAILRAESQNPGWKAVNVTESNISWYVTMKMK